MSSQMPSAADLASAGSGPGPNDVESSPVDPISLADPTLITAILLIILSFIFVAGRIVVHWRTMALADYMTIAGFVLATSYSSIIAASRECFLSPACWHGSEYLSKLLFSQNVILGITQFVLKTAILIHYSQLFAVKKKMRIAIRIGLIVCAILYLPHAILVSIFRIPAKGQSWADLATNDTSSVKLLFYGPINGIGSILLDIYIFVLPLPVLCRLNASVKTRLKLLAVFVVALLGVLASIFSTYWRFVNVLSPPTDYNWDEGQIFIWIMVEQTVALIVGCMPAFAVLVTQISSSKPVSRLRARVLGNAERGIAKPDFNVPRSKAQPEGARARRQNAFYYELDDSVLNTTVDVGVDDTPGRPGAIDEESGIIKTMKVLQESHAI
ncbi:hypothetical protein F4861DRAFT_542038 [Xylaria intraflava]|nr:hypothetical protein F4861DRAFT_542038 [Xylaria intraflava]